MKFCTFAAGMVFNLLMMKKFLFALWLAGMSHTAYADVAASDEQLLNLRTEARFDWQMDRMDGTTVDSNTGFVGKYLNLRADGTIAPGLSYSWRQRFNKPHKDASFFDATDWMYLNYDYGRWSLSGGKQIVAIGGWEYDRPPIDCYGCSVFWNNITCYGVGASVGYQVTPSDKLSFQFCESPFFSSVNRNLYGYNLMWNGTHGCFTAIYSANMLEYAPGRYISYLALGNKFVFDRVTLELDVMNRAASHQQFLLKDMSVMAELQYRPAGRWNIFGKFT